MFRLIDALDGLRPTPVFDPQLCTRTTASGCTRCVEACPVNALSVNGAEPTGPLPHGLTAPLLNSDACVSCGICVAACPSRAASGAGPNPAALAAKASETSSLHLSCTAASPPPTGQETLTITCVNALGAEALAACAGSLAPGGTLVVNTGDCAACPLNPTGAAQRCLNLARALATRIRPDTAVDVRTAQQGQSPAPETQSPAGANPAKRGGIKLSGTKRGVRKYGERGKCGGAVEVSRREILSGWHRPTPARSSASPRELLLTVASDPPLPRLSANADACTNCGACAAVCPTGALINTSRALEFSARDCLACGECVRVCPENALEYRPRATGQKPGQTLVEHKPAGTCGQCNRWLPPGESTPCSQCAAQAAIGEQIWQYLA